MWTCPECNTNVNDENVFCEVCGASRKPSQRHHQTVFSSLSESSASVPENGLRQDLTCVFVRAFGLYLVIDALTSLPNVIASFFAASEFGKVSLQVNASSGTGTFGSMLLALAVRNALALLGGLFLITSDFIIRVLARPIRP